MPKKNGVGNSASTFQKQEDFVKIMSMLGKIWKGVIKHSFISNTILYYDMNGGPGITLDYIVAGSPVLAAIVLNENNLDHRGYVSEMSEKNVITLRQAMMTYNDFYIVQGDNKTVLKNCLPDMMHKPSYGLVYADPNGSPRDEFQFLEYVSNQKSCRYIDFLISFGAAGTKRAIGAHPDRGHQIDARKLKRLKDFWFIREFMTKGVNKWCFLLGTNWDKFPIPINTFYSIGSDKGKELIDFFNIQRQDDNEYLNESGQISLLDGVS